MIGFESVFFGATAGGWPSWNGSLDGPNTLLSNDVYPGPNNASYAILPLSATKAVLAWAPASTVSGGQGSVFKLSILTISDATITMGAVTTLNEGRGGTFYPGHPLWMFDIGGGNVLFTITSNYTGYRTRLQFISVDTSANTVTLGSFTDDTGTARYDFSGQINGMQIAAISDSGLCRLITISGTTPSLYTLIPSVWGLGRPYAVDATHVAIPCRDNAGGGWLKIYAVAGTGGAEVSSYTARNGNNSLFFPISSTKWLEWTGANWYLIAINPTTYAVTGTVLPSTMSPGSILDVSPDGSSVLCKTTPDLSMRIALFNTDVNLQTPVFLGPPTSTLSVNGRAARLSPTTYLLPWVDGSNLYARVLRAQ